MRESRAIMADLAGTGLTPEQITLVMELSAAVSAEARPVEDEAAQRRRERDREYQARKRNERRQISADSGDEADTPSLSPSPKEKISNPHPHTHPEIKTRARKGHRLPVDWQPVAITGEIGDAIAAWPPGALERELARFRDWAAAANGPNALKQDWQATWRNWLRKADDEGRHKRNDPPRHPTSRPTTRQIGERVAARFAAGGNGNPDLLPRLGSPGGYVG